uniref:Uncharacterized protein n=1 Tax=Timema douglasi TaxID=61478 RepID=A0A7R8VLD9_TIMDO|nr:unnamed protein product [Timema douglasi]
MSIGIKLQPHDHGNNNMEDSPHFSESESDKKLLNLDVSIKDETNIEPEMGLSPQENANLTVKSEIQDSYGPVSSSGITWIKQEFEMEGNSTEYVDVSVNSEERDLHQQELVCDLPFIKEELEKKLYHSPSQPQLTRSDSSTINPSCTPLQNPRSTEPEFEARCALAGVF